MKKILTACICLLTAMTAAQAAPASNTVDRIIDLVPQVMDRVDAFIEKQNKDK